MVHEVCVVCVVQVVHEVCVVVTGGTNSVGMW